MKLLNLTQGTPEWHAHRRSHWNASDAPAMLGVSPYKTRTQLMRELATGVAAEIDDATQRRFDDGHRFEALARPLAEKIIGEPLAPCVGVDDRGGLSASFDGLTLGGEVSWEHKSLNAELRALLLRAEDGEPITGADLPEHNRVQMEHQCIVSGASRVLFMATRWEHDRVDPAGTTVLVEQLWCWYTPDLALRSRIVAGWEQFERDLADWKPEPAAPAAVATPVEGFGVLALRVEGRVLASNMDSFRSDAEAFLARLPKPAELQTDQDFADADEAVKACEKAEDNIEAATKLALAQMTDVNAVLNMAETVAKSIRAARLALSKAVATEKDNRKAALVRDGANAVIAHYAEINASLGEHRLVVDTNATANIGASIKGLKTLSSMREKIGNAVAAAKIDASQRAERVRQNIAVLAEFAEHAHLFADRVALCETKAPEDLQNLAAARIAEHKAREEERVAEEKRREEERERVRQQQEGERAAREEQRVREAEERGRQQAEAAANREREAKQAAEASREASPAAEAEPAAHFDLPQALRRNPAPAGAQVRLGEIQAAIAPLSIDAKGLALLNIHPDATEGAAKLYNESRFEEIRAALTRAISRAELRRAAA